MRSSWLTDEFRRLQERARRELAAAVEAGTVIRPDRCTGCDDTESEIRARPHVLGRGDDEIPTPVVFGHHTDYHRPLDVVWLCRSCHGRVHGAMKAEFAGAQDPWAGRTELRRFASEQSIWRARFATAEDYDAHVIQLRQQRQEISVRQGWHNLVRLWVLTLPRAERLDGAAQMVREGVATVDDAARFSVSEEDWRDSRQWRNWLAALRRHLARTRPASSSCTMAGYSPATASMRSPAGEQAK